MYFLLQEAIVAEIPSDLKAALETLIENEPSYNLKSVQRHLTSRYQQGLPTSAALKTTIPEAMAYALARMPATYGAVYATLQALTEALPTFSPKRLLDIGSGPGTALWAATEVFPMLQDLTALEREPSMQKIAKRLTQRAFHSSLHSVHWVDSDLNHSIPELATYDLIIGSYILGEISPHYLDTQVNHFWNKTEDALLLIEPGTPEGFARIRHIRDILLTKGAHILAPCPHENTCPISGNNWCHFSQRVARSRIHRHLKGGVAPYEDEKFSYVVVSRHTLRNRQSRILRHPEIHPGWIQLELCTPSGGLKTQMMTKKDREGFRQARKSSWGDTIQEDKN